MPLKLYEIVVEREKGNPVGDVFWLTEDQAEYAGRALKNMQDDRRIADYRILPTTTRSFAELQKWFDMMGL